MTQGPRRLKEDPDFLWETGCDLADEELAVGGFDLEAMRARMMARIDSGPIVGDGVPQVRPSSGHRWMLKPLAGALVTTVAVVGAYWLGLQVGSQDGPTTELPAVEEPVEAPVRMREASPAREPAASEREPAPVEEPAVVDPAPQPVDEAVAPAQRPGDRPEAVAPAAPEAPDQGEPAPSQASPMEAPPEPVSAPAEDAADPEAAGDDAVADARPVPSRGLSPLQAEQEALQPADEAFRAGRWAEARFAALDYLESFPNGQLRNDAELILLHSLFHLGDAAGTAELAVRLQDRPANTGQREEILRLRAESLVQLNRCAEALDVADELGRRDASSIRRACRGE